MPPKAICTQNKLNERANVRTSKQASGGSPGQWLKYGRHASKSKWESSSRLLALCLLLLSSLSNTNTRIQPSRAKLKPSLLARCSALFWADFSFGFQSEICFERRRNVATGRKRCEALQTTLRENGKRVFKNKYWQNSQVQRGRRRRRRSRSRSRTAKRLTCILRAVCVRVSVRVFLLCCVLPGKGVVRTVQVRACACAFNSLFVVVLQCWSSSSAALVAHCAAIC